MKILHSVASAAIASACLFATGAAADPVRDPVTIRVSHAGLDLASDAGRRVLARRVQSAVNRTCAPRTAGLNAFAESRRCRAEMMQDATVQTAALLTRNGTQLASLAGR
ncbi:UrcA family protein [Sphingomonas aerolata]|jgi:UrcA family protein|uniref:UrcA family protein n=1 Tax=Sphingomonas aerolata TaxID=185951 RepID=A0A2T4YRL3_9SPHN|nr:MULTISPECIES: UrcA family protein [Sphingomonas]MBP2512762.1 UrcA family protein [Sphingomonas sp. PvP018]NII59282.1 UrcA family protein [Sphingomonas aerolata]PTM46163.1 UrcA family protein [Sphingomonas aerolata]